MSTLKSVIDNGGGFLKFNHFVSTCISRASFKIESVKMQLSVANVLVRRTKILPVIDR